MKTVKNINRLWTQSYSSNETRCFFYSYTVIQSGNLFCLVNPLGISLSYLKQHESTSTGFIFAILCFSNVTIFSGGRVGYNRARFVSLFAHVCAPTGPSVSIMLILYIHPVLLLQTLCVTLLFARYFNFVILKPLWTRSLIVLKVTVFFDIIKLLSRVGLFFVFFFCCILIRCGRNFIFCWLGRVELYQCVVSKKKDNASGIVDSSN